MRSMTERVAFALGVTGLWWHRPLVAPAFGGTGRTAKAQPIATPQRLTPGLIFFLRSKRYTGPQLST